MKKQDELGVPVRTVGLSAPTPRPSGCGVSATIPHATTGVRKRLRLLDMFCCAGGAADGYSRAGFEIVGVDIAPQPRYRHTFILANALELTLEFISSFDAIHASPPCQFATELRHAPGTKHHDNLIPATRAILARAGKPYVIENVDGARAHLIQPTLLCGSMFGLGAAGFQLQRHRWFESNVAMPQPSCNHRAPVIGVYGGHVRCRSAKHGGRKTMDFVGYDKPSLAREAMQMPWATMREMSEAIPPAYTYWIGVQLRSASGIVGAAESGSLSSATDTPAKPGAHSDEQTPNNKE